MIARIGLSVDALTDTCGMTGRRLFEMRRQLAEALLAHSQVVLADDDGVEQLRARILELCMMSPVAGKYWDALLQYGRFVPADATRPKPLEEIEDLDELLEGWTPLVEAAVMEPTRAELLGLPEGDAAWRPPDGGIEIVCHDCVTASETIASVQQLDRRKRIRKGSDRETFWDERLAPLVRSATRLHIQDKYLGEGLMRSLARRRGSSATELGEAEWLLQRIGRDARDATVSLYMQHSRVQPLQELVPVWRAAVRRLIPRSSGVKEVRAYLLGDRRWAWKHDRHLRADNVGVELSAGFDRLRARKVIEDFTATYLYGEDVKKLSDEENFVRDTLRSLGERPVDLL